MDEQSCKTDMVMIRDEDNEDFRMYEYEVKELTRSKSLDQIDQAKNEQIEKEVQLVGYKLEEARLTGSKIQKRDLPKNTGFPG